MGKPMYGNIPVMNIQKILEAGEKAGLNETVTTQKPYSESQATIVMTVAEVNRLKETNKALENTYNRLSKENQELKGRYAGIRDSATLLLHEKQQRDLIISRLNHRILQTQAPLLECLNRKPIDKLEDSADRAFRFMGGLCMRDFPISTQREYELVFSELKQALISCNHKKGGRDK